MIDQLELDIVDEFIKQYDYNYVEYHKLYNDYFEWLINNKFGFIRGTGMFNIQQFTELVDRLGYEKIITDQKVLYFLP